MDVCVQTIRILILTAVLTVVSVVLLTAAEDDYDDLKWMGTPEVVYVGTPYDVISQMLHMANIKKDDLLMDLGCGDGRMLVLAAQKYGTRGIGIEIDPDMVREARRNAKKNDVYDLVQIMQADIFDVDISEADVLLIYLLPEMNQRLIPQIETMKPGSRLVFNNYDLPGFYADRDLEIVSNENNSLHTIFLYTTPLKPLP